MSPLLQLVSFPIPGMALHWASAVATPSKVAMVHRTKIKVAFSVSVKMEGEGENLSWHSLVKGFSSIEYASKKSRSSAPHVCLDASIAANRALFLAREDVRFYSP